MPHYENTPPSKKHTMNSFIGANQKFLMNNDQITERILLSADLEPIPFCPVIKSSPKRKTNVLKREGKGQNHQSIVTPMVTTVRVPCRARGVCDTHTPSNAYFEIPKNCEHGTILICSHEMCRDSGRRFRYCKTCAQVTAKRNFSKRHGHGLKITTDVSPVVVAGVDDSDVDSSSSKRRRTSVDTEHEDSLASLFVNAMLGGKDDGISNKTGNVPSTIFARRSSTNTESSSKLMVISRRELAVLELVKSRPNLDNRLATDRWMQDILNATSSHSQKIIMEDAFLADNEEELLRPPPLRMQSLDKIDLFTESFDNLCMR